MFNIKKASFEELRKKYKKAVRVNNDSRHLDQFSTLQYDIESELNKRQRAAIFQFCAHFADACMDDVDRFAEDDFYEINSFYCKNHKPHVVCFD